jgi:hypothetical protein
MDTGSLHLLGTGDPEPTRLHIVSVVGLDGSEIAMEVDSKSTWLAVKQKLATTTGRELEAMVLHEASRELALEDGTTMASDGMPSCVYLAVDGAFVGKQLASELLDADMGLEEVVDQLMDEDGLNLGKKQVCEIIIEAAGFGASGPSSDRRRLF